MAAVRHIGFVVTSHLHLRTLFHVRNIVSNFQIHWFSSFRYTSTFMFHHFGLKLLFWGAKFDILGSKYGSNVKIKHFTKRHIFAWFRAFWAIMRQNRSKGLISARASEKKSQESDISPICHSPEVPCEWIKLGMNVSLVDIINCDKFCDNLFKSLNFTGCQSSKFSHRNLTALL